MELITRKLREIHPYPNNPRKNDKSVDAVAESIAQCGYCAPIVIDEDGVILAGHTRYRALKKLGWKECEVCVAVGLTDEQKRKYRILDNRTNELSAWDFDKLDLELPTLDFGGFDFGFDGLIGDHKKHHEKEAERTRYRYANILNLEKAQFPGDGKYDIPTLEPVTELPPIRSWMNFSYVTSDKEPKGKAIQFFAHDYQFEFIWSNPEKYVEKLSRYVCVATPDFSPYGDMPFAAQLWNHYRKHWVGAYLQSQGLTVIPTIRASTDPRSFDWFLDGEPHGGIVLISAMWTGAKKENDIFRREYQTMVDTLNPRKVFVYGKYDVGKLREMGCEDVELIAPSVFAGREQYKDRVKRNGQGSKTNSRRR